jgi:uncharacterized ParB-like nuclease family protein
LANKRTITGGVVPGTAGGATPVDVLGWSDDSNTYKQGFSGAALYGGALRIDVGIGCRLAGGTV